MLYFYKIKHSQVQVKYLGFFLNVTEHIEYDNKKLLGNGIVLCD